MVKLPIKYLTILYCKYTYEPPNNYSTMMKYFSNNQDVYNKHVKYLTEPYNGYFDIIINNFSSYINLEYKDYIWCKHDRVYKDAKFAFRNELMRRCMENPEKIKYIVKYMHFFHRDEVTDYMYKVIKNNIMIHPMKFHHSWVPVITENIFDVEPLLVEIAGGDYMPNVKTISKIISLLASKPNIYKGIFKLICKSAYYLSVFKDNINMTNIMYIMYREDPYSSIYMDYKILKYLITLDNFKLSYRNDNNNNYTPMMINGITGLVNNYIGREFDKNFFKLCDLILTKFPNIDYISIIQKRLSTVILRYLLNKGMDPKIKIFKIDLLDYILSSQYRNKMSIILVLMDKLDDVAYFLTAYYKCKSDLDIEKILSIMYKKNPQKFINDMASLKLSAEIMLNLKRIVRRILPERIDKSSNCDIFHLSLLQNRSRLMDIHKQLFNTIPSHTLNNQDLCDALISYTKNIDYGNIEFK